MQSRGFGRADRGKAISTTDRHGPPRNAASGHKMFIAAGSVFSDGKVDGGENGGGKSVPMTLVPRGIPPSSEFPKRSGGTPGVCAI